ncbi:MAG: hypothetical protein JW914_01875 [Syntrophaceae bacterium]|nr:hypothetical protein [Syntrophaceae bacterium]
MKNITTKTILILFVLLLAGCPKPEVNYDELFTPPSVKIIQDQLFLKGGSSKAASACFVKPHAKIEKDTIYVFGTLLLSNDIETKIKLPTTNITWKIYWVNKDGSLIEMKKDL